MSSYPFVPVSNVFNPLDYTQLSDALTLEQADRRYLSLGGGVITGQLNVNGNILLNSVSLSTLFNVESGVGEANKVLILDANRDIRNIRRVSIGSNTNAGAMDLNISNTNANCAIRLGSSYTANNAITLQWNYISSGNLNNNLSFDIFGVSNQLVLNSAGNVGINTQPLERLHINNGNVYISNSSVSPQIEIGRNQTNNNSFIISYTHIANGDPLNRIVIGPRGATTNEQITMTSSGTVGIGSPTPSGGAKLEVLGNINISNGSSYRIGGSSIDNRYARIDVEQTFSNGMRNYTNQAAGSSANFLRWGHTSSSPDFIWSHLRSTTTLDNCLELKTSNSNNLGISFSTFSGVNSSDGCCMVINAVSGSGSFLSANNPSCNGALHINGSVSRAIPAGSRLISSGATSWAGSGVNIAVSVFATGNMWCAGFYVSSDIRLKRDIQPAKMDNCMNLLDVEVKTFKMKNEEGLNFGLIAQDLWDKELYYLTHLVKNSEVEEPDEKRGFQKNEALIVSYEKISLYLLEICKRLNERLKKLEKIIEEYDIVEDITQTQT